MAESLFAEAFGSRILPFESDSARSFAKLIVRSRALGRPMSREDAQIAAIAATRGAALATRNTKDFEHCGIRLVNPWTA